MNRFLSGAFGVLLTPFCDDGKTNFDVLEDELEFLCTSPIDGIFPCATTGEFIHLSPEENISIMKKTAQVVGSRKKIAAGACSSNLDTSVQYMRAAAEAGCGCAVVCTPYYIMLKQSDILEFYRRLAHTGIIKLVLYNIPMFTSEIQMDTFRALLQEPNIIGMKDSSANMKRIAHLNDICRRERPDFSILSGTDDCLVPALLSGCTGSMTAFSTILPEINAEIYRRFHAGDIRGAQELNQSYLPLLRLADSISFPAGYKLIMEQRGFKMGSKQVVSQSGAPFRSF